MRAISLWQPWASAIPAGLKTIETRHWPTRRRGPIAIHAAKRRIDSAMAVELADHPIVSSFFRAIGIDCIGDVNRTFPFGAIVAVANLVDCVPTESMTEVSSSDYQFGNFAPGRFAWRLDNIHRVDPPIPLKGRQGIFDWDEPDYITEIIRGWPSSRAQEGH